jgi:hypothetical protein
MNAIEVIAEARNLLESGDQKKAARLLGTAVYATADADLLRQIHELSLQGSRISTVGRLRTAARWNSVIHDSEMRLGAAESRARSESVADEPKRVGGA